MGWGRGGASERAASFCVNIACSSVAFPHSLIPLPTLPIAPQCFNRTDYKSVPRLPFIDASPSDEEMEAIKEANMGSDSAEAEALKDKVKVKAEQNDLTGIDLNTPAGKKEAAVKLLAASKILKVKLPEAEDEARIKVGTIIVQECQAGTTDANAILTKIVQVYGVEESEAEAAAAQESAGNACTVPANGGIMLMMKELKELYFKEGNANAGGR